MSVRKRTWVTRRGERREVWITDYVDQQGSRHIHTFARKKDADEYHATVKVDVRHGVHTAPNKSITVAQAADDWIAYVELEGRERTTVAQYRQHADQHIKPRIGRERLAKLTTPRINAFRDDLLASMSRPLAKKVLTSLKSLLRDAQRRGMWHRMSRPTSRSVLTSVASASSGLAPISQPPTRSGASSTAQPPSGGRCCRRRP